MPEWGGGAAETVMDLLVVESRCAWVGFVEING